MMINAGNKYLVHEQNIVVAVGDTDFNGNLKPSAIMGYCQDIATVHAHMLGFGQYDLLAHNLVWVLIRMSFKIHKTPCMGESLTIKTFPEQPSRLDVNRGYYIYNADGEVVISASSKWCVIDINTHKIGRLAPLFEKYTASDFIPNEPFEDANCKLSALPNLKDAKKSSMFTVQVTDLDQNHHMNNARYGDIILNACGVDILKENNISRLDINFMAELFINDKYEVYKTQEDNITLVEAHKAETDTVVFRAKVEWSTLTHSTM